MLMRSYPGVRADAESPLGYDLSTAAGYAAWRAAGGIWADETDEVLARAARAEARALAEDLDLVEVAQC